MPLRSLLPVLFAILALTGAADLPENGPVPVLRPADKVAGDREQAVQEETKDTDHKQTDEEQAAERPHEDVAAQAACRTALREIGATFEDATAVTDGPACGIEKPVLLKALPRGIKVTPEATVRCETALQLARWMDGAVKPSLSAAMPGETITGLSQASSYVCRNRNNADEGRISEHAFGNAIDIAGFALKSGKTITIRPADKDSTIEGAFQRAVTEAACLYFTTVLDPGSDTAHENHLHLDVKARRGGYRYCW